MLYTSIDRDPTGYLDEGKGLPWITMDYVERLISAEIEMHTIHVPYGG